MASSLSSKARMRMHHLTLLLALPLLGHALETQCKPDAVASPLPLLRHNRTCSVAVDDETADGEGRWATPWTETPSCLVPRSVGSAQKFCVYSSSAYNGNAGISVITTPDAAAVLAEAVRDPMPAWHARRHVARGNRLSEDKGEEPLPYTIVDMPGKGKGVVATRPIARYDTILVSYPAMVVDDALLPADEDEAPLEAPRLFQRALGQLVDKKRFLGLARSKGDNVHVVEDVVRTNAFGIMANGRSMKGLYPEIAVRSRLL